MRKYKAKLVIKLKSLVFSMYYKIISKIKGKLYCTSFFFVMMNRLSWAVDSKMRKPFIVWIHSFFVRILAIFPIICFWRICAEFWSDRQVNSAAMNFKNYKFIVLSESQQYNTHVWRNGWWKETLRKCTSTIDVY